MDSEIDIKSLKSEISNIYEDATQQWVDHLHDEKLWRKQPRLDSPVLRGTTTNYFRYITEHSEKCGYWFCADHKQDFKACEASQCVLGRLRFAREEQPDHCEPRADPIDARKAPSVGSSESDVKSKISDAISSEIDDPVPWVVAPTDFTQKRLRHVRGSRGGIYTRATAKFGGIIGITAKQYAEVLAETQEYFFGTAITETQRPRVTRIVDEILANTKPPIKLPATQRLKLKCQIWVDLTIKEGPEDHINTMIDANRDKYWSKVNMMGGVQPHWTSRLYTSTIKAVSFGWYDPAPAGLPRQ